MKIANLEVENAALLHANRRSSDVDWNGGANHLVHQDAHEVDVSHLAADRIDLNVFDHRVALLIGAGHLQNENRADAVLALLDELRDRLAIDGDRYGLAMATIDNGGHFSGTTESSGSAFALLLPPR